MFAVSGSNEGAESLQWSDNTARHGSFLEYICSKSLTQARRESTREDVLLYHTFKIYEDLFGDLAVSWSERQVSDKKGGSLPWNRKYYSLPFEIL